MSENLSPNLPTQSNHPWRATVRTVFAAVVGIFALLPVIVQSSGVSETTPGIVGALAVAAGVTRVLAVPGVNEFLQKYLPFLAADPKPEVSDHS